MAASQLSCSFACINPIGLWSALETLGLFAHAGSLRFPGPTDGPSTEDCFNIPAGVIYHLIK